MSDTGDIRVILNPNAGQKMGVLGNGSSPDEIDVSLRRYGIHADIVVTDSEDDARAHTRDAIDRRYRVVVAAGGDGTAGLVAGELLGASTALGILPLGSVMNMGRMLGIPRNLDTSISILAAGHVRSIDVGRANGTLFYEGASAGMIAPVFRDVQRIEHVGPRAILSAIRTAARYRPSRLVIHLDDRVITTRSLLVTVANGPYTGMGLTVAPDARVDDGLFDVRVFQRFGRLGLALYLISVSFGRRRYSPRIRTYRASKVRIESTRPQPCRADGHDLGMTPVTLTLLPRVLRVVAPPNRTA